MTICRRSARSVGEARGLQSRGSMRQEIWGNRMPLIQVKLIDEVFTPAQKTEVIAKLTEAIVSIKRGLKQPVTLVVIEEGSSEGSEP